MFLFKSPQLFVFLFFIPCMCAVDFDVDDWSEAIVHNGRQYVYFGLYFDHDVTQSEAAAGCAHYGGYLTDFQEQWVMWYLKEEIEEDLWIGVEETANGSNIFRSTHDGTIVTYTSWAAGEPADIAGRRCVYVDDDYYYWHAISCVDNTTEDEALCKLPVDVYPGPKNFVYVLVDMTKPSKFGDYESVCDGSSYMVDILSQDEMDNITARINHDGPVWIGLRNETDRGTYEWERTGDPVVYTNWHPDANHTLGVDTCVYANATDNWRWYTAPCDTGEVKYGLCKVEVEFIDPNTSHYTLQSNEPLLLYSPGYEQGNEYPDDVLLTYTFTAPADHRILVVILDLETEDCEYDFLMLHPLRATAGPSTPVKAFCDEPGDYDYDFLYISNGTTLDGSFHTDGGSTYRGWMIRLVAVPLAADGDVGVNCTDIPAGVIADQCPVGFNCTKADGTLHPFCPAACPVGQGHNHHVDIGPYTENSIHRTCENCTDGYYSGAHHPFCIPCMVGMDTRGKNGSGSISDCVIKEVITAELKLGGNFTEALGNPDSAEAKALATEVENGVATALVNVTWFRKLDNVTFRSGSIIVSFGIIIESSSLQIKVAVLGDLTKTVSAVGFTVGGYSVEPIEGNSFVRFGASTCGEGYRLNSTTGVPTCERTCEDGYRLNNATGVPTCERVTCGEGFQLNNATGTCELSLEFICGKGYWLNNVEGVPRCERSLAFQLQAPVHCITAAIVTLMKLL